MLLVKIVGFIMLGLGFGLGIVSVNNKDTRDAKIWSTVLILGIFIILGCLRIK